MEKEKNDKVEPDKAPKEKKPLTEEQRIKRNKMIAIPCMCLVCGLVLWLIFKPSASEGEKGSKGFNMEMQGRRIKLNFPSTAYLSSPHSIPLSVVLD